MTRAAAALRTLAVAASLAAACLTIRAAPAMAAGPPATGRIAFDDFVTGQIYAVNPDGTALAQLTHEPKRFTAQWPGLVAQWVPHPVRPAQPVEWHGPHLDHERQRNRPAAACFRRAGLS